MAAVYTDILPDDNTEPGIHRGDFATAVSVWSWMQQGDEPPTVAAAALAFNTTPDLVRVAVRDGYWTFLCPDDERDPTKQHIEHDGE